MAKRSAPEVNAGSMADIAFLLLIFFLVTTTMQKDKGILRSLPPIEPPTDEQVIIKEKNLFIVLMNSNDQLFVEEKEMDIKDLRQAAIDFLDNGGGTDPDGNVCDYCKGKNSPASSDHPDKAIITLQHNRETSYGKYIEVQNELLAAYSFLRNRESERLYNVSYTEMLKTKEGKKFDKDEKLNARIKAIQELYPLKLSEAEPKKN